MAFADPQTITVNSVAQTLNRVKDDGLASVYQTDDGLYKFVISHQETKTRFRRMVRVDQKVIAADPLTALNSYQSLGIYLVIDQPTYGFSTTQIDHVVQALKTWLSTANVTKLVASQH